MKLIVGLLVFSLSSLTYAADQVPADNQARGACKEDIQKLCPDVKRGGGRIAACLKNNSDKLSDACKTQIAKARTQHNANGNGKDGSEKSDDSK